ncbi:MAG: Bax inhibitor-1/YccA family protein [Desulfarculaceae bacterium]
MDRVRTYPSGPATADRTMAVVNAFMRRVYNWMAGGLALSAVVAWVVMNSPSILGMFITPQGPTMLFWGAIIAELGMVFAISAGIKRFAVGTAAGLFLIYSGLNGITLAPLLLIYTGASVFKAFAITAGTFAVTSIWASTTKKDLSGWGSFLFMGLIGIIIASVVNMFLGSAMIDWIVSIVGVGIFVGLTAYDTQMLRTMVLEAANEVTVAKMAIFGALKLYLDFINLFILLLRFFGERR